MLSDKELQVLFLAVVERLNYREIAKRLDASRQSVKHLMQIVRLKPIGDLLDAITERKLTEAKPETISYSPYLDSEIKEKF